MILAVVFAPLMAGLLCLLWRRGIRIVLVLTYISTAGVGIGVLVSGKTLEQHLTGSYGVSLLLDPAAAWFLLLNAAVSTAVAWHERGKPDRTYFLTLLTILHGCLNACFLSTDLFNLYVVIELSTVIAYLLMGQNLKPQYLWNALRYLFLSNVGMLFFLMGSLLVYEATGSFSLAGVIHAPPTAKALIVTGLLVKGGVFLPGLWLPQAHAESETAVSALLSGVVVKIGLLPLIRLASCSPDLEGIIRMLGLGGIFLGLGLGFCQRDFKRVLACSTISQVGFILLVPAAGAVYAFAHGLAKASLFLCASSLPERDLLRLQDTRVGWPVSWPLILGALSIAGCPLLFGFNAKYRVMAALSGWPYGIATLASVGTTALMTPLILMPRRSESWRASSAWQAPMLLGAVLLLSGLCAGPHNVEPLLKSAGILIAGILLHKLLLRYLMAVALPKGWEKLEHVVGMTCCVLLMVIMAVYLS